MIKIPEVTETEIRFEDVYEFEIPEHEYSIYYFKEDNFWAAERWDESEDAIIIEDDEYKVFSDAVKVIQLFGDEFTDEELDAIVKEAETDVGETIKLDGIERYFSVTQLEAIQALQEEGVENPTDTQVKNKQKELLKLAVEAAKRAAKETVGFKNTKELEDEAKDQLISEGILEPTDQQIKERANAIQESSATQVDVQESTPDSPEVGEGDAPGVVTPESQTQEQVADQPIETQTQEEIKVNVAPFFETSIESTTEAGGLRKSPQYQQFSCNSITYTSNSLFIFIPSQYEAKRCKPDAYN